MSKTVLLIVVFFLQCIYLIHFTQCKYFNEPFFLHPRDVNLQLGGDIYGDKQPVWLVRIFHNKLEAYSIAVFDSYFYYFYFPFLLNFLSAAGLFGLLAGFYFISVHKRDKIAWWLLTPVLIVPALELFIIPKIPFFISMVVLWLAFQSFSLYGYFQFLNHQKSKFVSYATVSVLVFISIVWIFAYNNGLGAYCHIVH